MSSGRRRVQRRIRWLAAAATALLIVIGLALGDDADGPDDEGSSSRTETSTSLAGADHTDAATASSTIASAPATSAAADDGGSEPLPERGTLAAVYEIVDGDTVKVDLGGIRTTIRIIGIDTPETVHPTKPVECFGPEASRRANELLDGRTVGIEYDGTQGRLDRYGRTLAYLWLPDGQLYTSVMLSEGFAHEYTYDRPYRYRDEHLAAQAEARRNGRGLWDPETCGGDTDQPASNTTVPRGRDPGSDDFVYYRTCAEAREAGAAPIRRGEPGYRPSLDGDEDGIACE